jgi:hypothetical protein
VRATHFLIVLPWEPTRSVKGTLATLKQSSLMSASGFLSDSSAKRLNR